MVATAAVFHIRSARAQARLRNRWRVRGSTSLTTALQKAHTSHGPPFDKGRTLSMHDSVRKPLRTD